MMPSTRENLLHGLYAITPETADSALLARKVAAAVRGGATVVQYRNKRADANVARHQAQLLREITHASGSLLVINDNIELALLVKADAVHLGKDDGDILDSVALCHRQNLLVGVSCYNELARAAAAIAAGADYVAFGSFFASPTKPAATRAEPALIRTAKSMFEVPIVGIGGITISNGQQLIACGVDMLAVITALFDAEDVASRAREFTKLFEYKTDVHQK